MAEKLAEGVMYASNEQIVAVVLLLLSPDDRIMPLTALKALAAREEEENRL